MGYELHITRASHWTESEETPISLDEWMQLVTTDPEMRLDNVAEVTTPAGDVLRYENEGLAVWTGYSAREVTAWFDYREGRIAVKNPDEEVIEKMRNLAAALDARVIGDEGEAY